MHPLDPIEFYQIPQVFRFRAQRVGMYEVLDMDLHVFQALVVREVEVFTNLTLWFVLLDIIDVGLESVHQPILGLPHILEATTFACEAIFDI